MLDQAFYAGHCAAGQTEVMQVMWLYERAVDMKAVERLHRNLGYTLFGRRIERSPLPFGRHRWVFDRAPSDIDVAACPRPRSELSDWLDERSQIPVDPETGPSWHFGVLPLTDGSMAVSLVMSHYVCDGVGGIIAVTEALMGLTRDLGYPPPHSRSRLRAVIEDAGETVRAAPEVARALVAGARMARSNRDLVSTDKRPAAVTGDGGGDLIVVPGVAIYMDMGEWDARARALGGTSSTLTAGFTAKLGEHLGFRHGKDGDVTVQLLVNNRGEGDTRALAVTFVRVNIDPTRATTDLSEARVAIKQALTSLRETPDNSSLVAALTPFTSKRTWKRLVDTANTDPDHPVVCSNLGELGPTTRLDGTDCDYPYARGTRQGVTRQWLEQIGGQLQVLSLRASGVGKVAMTVLAYQPGAQNTKAALRELCARALAEFGLTGEID
ncbi:hypothetical protein H7K15_18020 [Mycobacterium parmense]|nr:hypothetical protein [Mycobacterium parmense]MCV7352022.1 hypothetical protein [Mycobacterium parmense]ORW56775.1 hypothetical protein AWC20_01750 [Mycobacterium parmense]